MTIDSIPPNDRVERFTASAGQTVFSWDFPLYEVGSLDVRRRRAGVETALLLGGDYTATGAGEQGGGSITLTAPALAGDIIIVISAQPVQRTTKFEGGGDFRAETVNAELNRVWIEFQQLRAKLALAVRAPVSDGSLDMQLPIAEQRVDGLLGFDAGGLPVILPRATFGGFVGPPGPPGPPGTSRTIGELFFTGSATTPPMCFPADGRAVSRTTYAALFAAIGTTHGAGDGTTTFNIQDARGSFILTRDNLGGTAANRVTVAVSTVPSTTLGGRGGSERLQQHGHGVTDPGHLHTGSTGTAGSHTHTVDNICVTPGAGIQGGVTLNAGFGSRVTDAQGSHTHAVTVASAATGVTVQDAGLGGTQNVPPCLVQNAWVYAGVATDGSGAGGSGPAPTYGLLGVSAFFSGLTVANEVFRWSAPVSCVLAAGPTGARASASANATALTTLTLFRVPGGTGTPVSIGTLTYAGGSRTGAFTVAADVTFAAGDVLEVALPATPDATLANLHFTMTLQRI
jgi:microcystin-dependent protein